MPIGQHMLAILSFFSLYNFCKMLIQMLMNASVAVTTVAMGLVLTYQALILVSALLAMCSTLTANNVLVNYLFSY